MSGMVLNNLKIEEKEMACCPVCSRTLNNEGSSVECKLHNLLALIHRDGGHYLERYGLDRALQDAERIVVERTSALEELVSLKNMKDRLHELHEMGYGTDYEAYYKRKPLAWASARAALGNWEEERWR